MISCSNVAGKTSKSLTALTNLKRICETYLAGQYRIELIDLLQTPQLAAGDQILAVPTLVRRLPLEGKMPTNVAFGPPGERRIYVTEQGIGRIEVLDVETEGWPLFA